MSRNPSWWGFPPIVDTPERVAWRSMQTRCNPRNSCPETRSAYGDRGITVSPEWRESFAQFLEDMGPRPGPEYSLDRIDNDGNYEAGNCRWATKKQQIDSRRPPKKYESRLKPGQVQRIHEYLAEDEHRTNIAKWFGVTQATISRIASGKSGKRAMTMPPQPW